MRKWAQLTAVAVMMGFAGSGSATQAAPQNSEQAKPASSPAAPQDSLAEAARKARQRKKEEPAATKVFTNDNLPTTGGISSVGAAAAPGSTAPGSDAKKPGAQAGASSGSAENTWRDKFATLRHKLEQDQDNLAVLQRELGTLNTQFYADPNKQLQQQLTRSDIDKKTAEINAATQQVAADQKAIDDAETDLRASGGDPGWAR
jgi:hypothetical protein